MILSKIINRIFRNFWIKLFSLFLAMLLWFHVKTEGIFVTTRAIPVHYLVSPGKVIVNRPPDHVTVNMEAKGKILIMFALRKPKVQIDLRKKRIGKHKIRITAKNIVSPSELTTIKLRNLSPSVFYVDLDTVITRKIKVEPVIVGAPPKDYVLMGYEISPKYVEVSGPSRFLNRLRYLRTEPIHLEKKKKTFEEKIKLELRNMKDKVTCRPEEVTLKVEIEPMVKRVFKRPIQFKPVTKRYRIKILPETLKVFLKGPKSIIDTVSEKRILVYVKMKKLRSGEYTLKPHILYPRTFELEKIEPATLKVVLKRMRR